MKIRGKRISKWAWIPAAVAAGLVALYLARWPLFGGLVRDRLDRLASQELQADLDVGNLEGSLIFSIGARNVRLRPREGSPFKSLTVDRLDVDYGLFGLATPRVTLKGVRAALAESDAPGPPAHRSIRDALRTLPTFQLPVSVRVRDGRIRLADGTEVAIDRAVLDESEWTVQGTAPLFGSFEARAEFDREEKSAELRVEAGTGDGNRLIVSGSLGETIDLRLDLGLTPPESLNGRLAAEIRLTGTTARPELEGWVRLEDLSYESARPFSLELSLVTRDGVLEILGDESTSYGEFHVEGRVPLAEARADDSIRVVASLSTGELAPLIALVANPEDLGLRVGSLNATVEVGGPIGAPTWKAEAQVNADTLLLPGPLGPLRDIDIRAGFESGRLRLSALTATLGHGPLRASGHWDPGAPGRPLRLEVKGENLLVVDELLVRVRLSPDLVLTKDDGSPWKIQGGVAVPLAIIHSEFVTGRLVESEPEEEPAEFTAPGINLPSAPGGGFFLPGLKGAEEIALDLRITTPGEIRIENRTLGVLFEGELDVRGTAAEPVASGTVRVRRGEVKVGPGIFIRIVSGRATLPAEPGKGATVRLVGRVGSGEGAVRIVADGPLESPDLELRSDPPRSDEEILSYLAFGRWPGELSGGSALEVFALEVYEQFTDSLPSADRRESLVERLNPTLVPEEEAGRRAPWELPVAGTGRGFVLRTEYFLNRHFSVVLESDREGSVLGNLKLRYRF